jgi:hypothetical protein
VEFCWGESEQAMELVHNEREDTPDHGFSRGGSQSGK